LTRRVLLPLGRAGLAPARTPAYTIPPLAKAASVSGPVGTWLSSLQAPSPTASASVAANSALPFTFRNVIRTSLRRIE